MTTSLNTVPSARKVKNERPSQTKIARRKSARKMAAVKTAISLHRPKKKWAAIPTMPQQRKDAAGKRKKRRPRHKAQLIQVRYIK